MGVIYISDLRLHAFHGVLPQERIVGNDYVINLSVEYPMEKAAETDDVADTMNYAEAVAVIEGEMAKHSNLLEHVAHRICCAILERFPLAASAEIDLRKVAPPMKACCSGAGVKLRIER